MRTLKSTVDIIREHRYSYIATNLFYFGLVGLGMVTAAINRQVQEILLEAVDIAFTEGPLSPIGSAYSGGDFLQAILFTFVINLILGCFITITLPSLIIPFSGILMGAFRAFLWGLIFSPVSMNINLEVLAAGALIFTLILLEGHAYTLAMEATYFKAQRSFLQTASTRQAGRTATYSV
jgi:hypothetical protein